MVFFRPKANCKLQIHFALHVHHAALHQKQLQNFCQNAALTELPKFRHSAALPQNTKSAQILNCFLLLHIPNSPLPITLSSSLLKALPCFETAFAGRTSWRFGAVYSFYSLRNNILLLLLLLLIIIM